MDFTIIKELVKELRVDESIVCCRGPLRLAPMIPHVTDQTALISAVRFECYNSEQIKKAELIGKHMVAER